MQQRPSPNYDSRGDAAVDMLVLHYTGMQSGREALDRLCNAEAKVSAHYLIEEDGNVWSLVDEDHRAWHAGVAYWRGATNINARSIGIELVNPGHEWGYCAFPEPQMIALLSLAGAIVARHGIMPGNVVGHSDVAPTRKEDPGELFDWKRLAAAGIGLWPEDGGERAAMGMDATRLFDAIGYETTDLPATIRAFQRRFRPDLIDGLADDETIRLAQAVASLVAGEQNTVTN